MQTTVEHALEGAVGNATPTGETRIEQCDDLSFTPSTADRGRDHLEGGIVPVTLVGFAEQVPRRSLEPEPHRIDAYALADLDELIARHLRAGRTVRNKVVRRNKIVRPHDRPP